MSVWFEGEKHIACTLDHVRDATDDLGAYFVGALRHLPSLYSVELVKQDERVVHIKTNEGLMKRTVTERRVEDEAVHLMYDEVFDGGSMITVTAHYEDTFTKSGDGVTLCTVISEVEAPGFLGFFYRNFGASSNGKSFQEGIRKHLEGEPPPEPKK